MTINVGEREREREREREIMCLSQEQRPYSAYACVEEQQPYSGPMEAVLVTSRVVLSLILKSENNLIW